MNRRFSRSSSEFDYAFAELPEPPTEIQSLEESGIGPPGKFHDRPGVEHNGPLYSSISIRGHIYDVDVRHQAIASPIPFEEDLAGREVPNPVDVTEMWNRFGFLDISGTGTISDYVPKRGHMWEGVSGLSPGRHPLVR